MDRVSPTRRPIGQRTVMWQRWADLLFLHWPVPPDELAALLPPGLTLDTFDGQAYVGLVPFTMTGVRPVWAPALPWLSHFHETNVRTYVHCRGRDPGVWFFSLDAANPVAVKIARALWKLPYHFARMRLARAGNGMAKRWITRRNDGGPVPCPPIAPSVTRPRARPRPHGSARWSTFWPSATFCMPGRETAGCCAGRCTTPPTLSKAPIFTRSMKRLSPRRVSRGHTAIHRSSTTLAKSASAFFPLRPVAGPASRQSEQ
jgi:hypothetical protein